MKVLVCGGRDYDNWYKVDKTLQRLYTGTGEFIIIEGGAKGADFLARVWAVYNDIEYIEVPADVKKYGSPKAFFIRNQEMADMKPDICVAFPGGTGTADMVSRCRKQNILVKEIQ